MNRGSRHMRYRKSVYRRQRARTVLIVTAVVLCVLLVAFFVIGSMFFDKLQKAPEPPEETKPQKNELPSYPFENVPHVKAPLLTFDEEASTVYRRAEDLIEAGHTALSLPLTDDRGTLLYHSDQATDGDYAIRGSGSLLLSSLSELAHASGVRVCGTYVLDAATEENELTRSVLLAESSAVLAEAFLAGVDDIVIVVPSLPTDRYTELIRMAESIRSFAPNAVVGLSLPDAEIAAPDATRMDMLAKSFDYLAIDLRTSDTDNAVTFAEERMGTMLYYLLRYEMRAMLPALSDEETQAELMEAVEKESIDNWMMLEP